MKWQATHVCLGKSRDYAWCGRYVGFHGSLTAMTEEQVIEALGEDRGAHVCATCRKSLARSGPEPVKAALVAFRERAMERYRQAQAKHAERGSLQQAIRDAAGGG